MKWLTVVGMGEDGWAGLSARSQESLRHAEIIVGSKRLLGKLPTLSAERKEWPQPFSAVIERIQPLRGRATAILATGDPMNFGVTRKLMEFVPFAEMTVIPHLSAFSLAASRLGWSLPDCDCFSIHGRPAANLETFIQPGARLLALTENAPTIAEACRRLVKRGFGESEITVLENLGGDSEMTTSFIAHALPDRQWSDLNTLAVRCIAGPQAQILSRVPGLPDDAFGHDGKITKREVRAATLAALSPAPDQLLWDVGAGCGSIGIEWMRSTRGCEAIAIEPDAERRRMIAANADALGTPRLKIVAGTAPTALEGLKAPDAVFIGGGLDDEGVFEAAWLALKSGGAMVANTVTLEAEMHLIDLQAAYGGDLVRFEISHLASVGPYRGLKPKMPVLQWRGRKP
ncbi:MAG: precorrin-6y C5,15-methyltransferase (decarboxylating) subunit CbiE [Aestuariivirga sp.]